MAQKIDLSVIIVNFNTKKLLEKLLKSIEQSQLGQFKLEVIVIDNDSSDGSVELVKKRHRQVRLIANDRNLGFAKANNQGLKQARGRYLLLLNSDTQVQKETFETMVKFMDKNPRYGVATCRVELPNSQLDPASHRGIPTPWAALTYFLRLEQLFPKSKLFGQYHQGWKDLGEIHEVEVISGAFFLVRRGVIEKVGLLDEGYFMYGEDIDWCLRIREAGFKIAYVPSTKITHVKGQSGRAKSEETICDQKNSKNLSNHFFWDTMKLFYKKHFQKKYPRPLMWLIFRVIDLKISSTNKD